MNRILFLLALLACHTAQATCELRADTANTNFAIGPFVDPSTGDAETALTVADGDVLWKQPDSTTIAEETGFTDCTHRAAGMYTCPYDATVVDTEGLVTYVVDVAGALTVFGECMVLDADYFDLKYGATGLLTNNCSGGAHCDSVTVTNQTTFVLTTGPSNNDAFTPGQAVKIVGGTETCHAQVLDYVGSTETLTISTACSALTVATADLIYIYPGASAEGMAAANTDLSLITGTTGVVLDDDSITANKVATDAFGASEIASGAITTLEIATGAIDADAMASDSIGSAELAATGTQEIVDDLMAEVVDGTISVKCAFGMTLAYSAGKWTRAGNVVTYRNPGDTTNRIVGTIDDNVSFDSITRTCP